MCNIIAVAKQKEFQINKTYNRAESSKRKLQKQEKEKEKVIRKARGNIGKDFDPMISDSHRIH